MAAAEERLLEAMGDPSGDLFRSREDLVAEAYDRQANRIAYVRSDAAEAFGR